jgi:hypothetical protein
MLFSAYLGGTNSACLHRYDSRIRAHQQEAVLVQAGGYAYTDLRAVYINASSANPGRSLLDARGNRDRRRWIEQQKRLALQRF